MPGGVAVGVHDFLHDFPMISMIPVGVHDFRFVNWLHNGKGPGDTESGVYDLSLSPELITRAPGASYFLPDRDEWYKAAYYDPTKGGTSYWLYPTRSRPTSCRRRQTLRTSAVVTIR